MTWIANEPSCREQVFKWVSPEDFSEGLTRKIAVLFDKQIKDKGDINPAEIVDSFKDVSVHSEVSAILNAEVYFDGEQENDAGIRNQMKSKAITETVLRVKEAGIDRRMKEIMDMSCSKEEQNTMFLKLMDEQALLKKLYITFGNG